MSKDKVLIVTHALDDHVLLVTPEFELLGVEYVRFNTEQFTAGEQVEFVVCDGVPETRIHLADGMVSSNEIGSVLFRHIKIPFAQEISDPHARRMAESELMATLQGGLLALDARWFNHPHANQLTRNKPLQLAVASRLGFNVPDTRITNDPAKIRVLFKEWGGQMVAKLVGGQLPSQQDEDPYVIHTILLEEEDLEQDVAFSACPAIYQRRIPKDYELRVTVVGDEIFTCRQDSQGTRDGLVDWRAAGFKAVPHSEFELDEQTAELCLAITRHFGLEMAGIDLAVTPDGQIVFFEINAQGQWAWVQEQTGMPIAAAIARGLVGSQVGQ